MSASAACPPSIATFGLPDEILGKIFSHLDTRTVTMVVPRVCHRWKHACATNVLPCFELGWAGPLVAELDDAALTAIVRSLVGRVGGARQIAGFPCSHFWGMSDAGLAHLVQLNHVLTAILLQGM